MTITISTLINAPLDDIWRRWTAPQDIVQWNTPSDDWHTTKASVDLRAGGLFSSRMEAKDGSFGFEFSGTYTEVTPQSLINATLDDGRKLSVVFEQTPTGVTVTETFDPENINPIEMQRAGWQAILDRFAAHLHAHNPG